MSYQSSWSDKTSIFVRQQFSEAMVLEDLIDRVGCINFPIQKVRNETLEEVRKLQKQRLFTRVSKDKRFPVDEFYVNLNLCGWTSMINDLCDALSYKPTELAFMVNTNDGKSTVKDRSRKDDKEGEEDATKITNLSERDQFNKAKVKYTQTLVAMRDSFGRQCGIYGREKFECEFTLKWNDKKKEEDGS